MFQLIEMITLFQIPERSFIKIPILKKPLKRVAFLLGWFSELLAPRPRSQTIMQTRTQHQFQ